MTDDVPAGDGEVEALGPIPEISSFAINPIGEGDITVEGGSRFAHESDVAKVMAWARAAEASLASETERAGKAVRERDEALREADHQCKCAVEWHDRLLACQAENAKLVEDAVAVEREVCALLVERAGERIADRHNAGDPGPKLMIGTCVMLASAIRARATLPKETGHGG